MMDNGNLHLRALHPQSHQGVCADAVATLEGITREDVDGLGFESQQRAANAIRAGHFAKSLVPVLSRGWQPGARPGGDTAAADHTGRAGGYQARLHRGGGTPLRQRGHDLRNLILQKFPELDINFVHHAGNSSGVVDGSAALLLASPGYARRTA